jgi:hypothetical protein
MPRLGVSPGGRIDAVFYDRRLDPRNQVNEVFYTHSIDSGRTFRPNLKVTAEGSYSKIGQQYANPSAQGQVEFGNRLGMVSRDEELVVAWADTRNSRPDTTAQDVFARVVALPPLRRPPWGVVGAALVGGGVLISVLASRTSRRRRSGAVNDEVLEE